ncbi:MAG: hypothetical protein ABS75_25600 [Pelagibacterium sp. SCN 63-23]|nr:MAG: hypothetical protein ABS75_25600 [Pelagibacterium sp. SCN 63-23]
MASTTDLAPTRRKSGNGGRTAAAKTISREQELEAQVAQLQSDLKAITETLSKLTGEKVGEARQIASTEFKHLQRQGQKMIGEAQDQVGEVEKQLKDTIREKPLTAVTAALGAGFVLALLMRH